MYRDKLRIQNKLTNCDNGDKIVFVTKLKNDLPKSLSMGRYYEYIWYHGQPKGQGTKCIKCLETVHSVIECSNEWQCLNCNENGHKRTECQHIPEEQNEDNNTDKDETEDNERELMGQETKQNTQR